MKPLLGAMAVLAFALSGALTPATAVAGGNPGGCGAAIAGLTAQADFTSAPDASGNITQVFMFAQQAAPSSLLLAINVYNATTYAQVSSAASCVTLPTGSLTISRDLTSGQLSPVTVQLFDYINNVFFNVTAGANWVGSGALTHGLSTSIQNSPGFHESAHLLDTSRPATATGAVTGTGTSYINTPSDFGELDDVKYGAVTVGVGGGPGPGGNPGGCGAAIAGLTAQADFTSAPDASGNVTQVFMFAQQAAPPSLVLAINVYNATTYDPVSSAASCVTLPTGSLTISRDLTSGQLSPVTVQLFDYINNVSFNVTASANWVGSGALTHSLSTSIQNSPGFHESAHLLDTSRPATATGTVTGTETSYINTPSDFGELDDVHYGAASAN